MINAANAGMKHQDLSFFDNNSACHVLSFVFRMVVLPDRNVETDCVTVHTEMFGALKKCFVL